MPRTKWTDGSCPSPISPLNKGVCILFWNWNSCLYLTSTLGTPREAALTAHSNKVHIRATGALGQSSVKTSHYQNPHTAKCMIWQFTGAIGLTQMFPSLHKEEEENFWPEDTLQKGQAMPFQATSFQATEGTWSQSVIKHHHRPTTTSLHGFNWQICIWTSHMASGI